MNPTKLAVTAIALALTAYAAYVPTRETHVISKNTWVVDSVGYSRHRHEHWATCLLDSDHTRRMKVTITAEVAYGDTVEPGTPCPTGPARDANRDGPTGGTQQ